jgi:hypothetical protein
VFILGEKIELDWEGNINLKIKLIFCFVRKSGSKVILISYKNKKVFGF